MSATNQNQSDSFLPRFYRLATVSVLSNMMVPLAGLCDTAFLGHLQELKYLAGVILGSILFDYQYRILKFLRNSTNAMTAQAAGKEDSPGVLLAGLRSSLIAIAIALLILILQYPIQKLGFLILSGTQDIESAGAIYFNARIWGAPAVLLNFVLIGWFLGREKNGIVFLISAIGNGSNVFLDYLMISRWGWASMGAGLATALSQYLALFVGLIAVILTINRQDLKQALPKVLESQALQNAVTLKANIMVRFLALISAYSIFTNLSAGIGTELLAERLLRLLSFTAIAYMLEAYFIGLKAGEVLRNGSLIAFLIVFLPVVTMAWYFHSIELLWLSLNVYILSLVLYLTWQMLKMQHNLVEKTSISLEII